MTNLSVLKDILNRLILRPILDGPKNSIVARRTNFQSLSEFYHLLKHLIVNILVNIDSLCRHANLTRVLKSPHNKFWGNLFNVHVRKDNGGVVATELESDALKCLGTGGHDFLARSDGTSEGDLSNAGVLCQHRAKAVDIPYYLHDTRFKNLLCELDNFESSVWREWTWLHDNRVTGEYSRNDLADGKDDGKIPRADGTNDTKGGVSGDNDLIFVFIAILFE